MPSLGKSCPQPPHEEKVAQLKVYRNMPTLLWTQQPRLIINFQAEMSCSCIQQYYVCVCVCGLSSPCIWPLTDPGWGLTAKWHLPLLLWQCSNPGLTLALDDVANDWTLLGAYGSKCVADDHWVTMLGLSKEREREGVCKPRQPCHWSWVQKVTEIRTTWKAASWLYLKLNASSKKKTTLM